MPDPGLRLWFSDGPGTVGPQSTTAKNDVTTAPIRAAKNGGSKPDFELRSICRYAARLQFGCMMLTSN